MVIHASYLPKSFILLNQCDRRVCEIAKSISETVVHGFDEDFKLF